ncbi:WD40 repeat-like protein [Suillus brevipes Sb2]|nr:WD40 repeat-like protein [Suillus brevipes Sb2]
MSQLIPRTTPHRTFEDHEDAVWAVAVFPDRRRMVTGSYDQTLRIWDLETGVVLKKMEGHSQGVTALAVSRDGQIIASGDDGGEVITWHGESGEPLTKPIKAGSKRVASLGAHPTSLAWTPDGTRLLSGGDNDDPTIREWDPLTWQQVGHPWKGHTGRVWAIAIDPAGTLVASASSYVHVRLWRLSDGQNIGIFEHSSQPHHEDAVWAVAVFPDRRRMVTGSYDKILRIWDLETGVVLKKMEGHSSQVLALAVSRDGQIIASGDLSGELIVWHGETGESLTKPIKAHSNQINSVDFSPDGTVLAFGSWDGMTKFWCTKSWQMQGDPIECDGYCIRYSPSGEFLAIATYSNIVIYNPGTRERVASFGVLQTSLAWTPDGTRLLSGGDMNDPTIREWDPLTWQEVNLPWKGHTGRIWAIAIDPNIWHPRRNCI